MPVPTIQIPNPLIHGDYLRTPPPALGFMAGPPTIAVKLGAILLPPEKKSHQLRFAAVRTAGRPMTPPAKTTWATKAAAAINRMYANDRLGDCTFAALYGMVGGWTANDTPVCVTVPDAEVVANYMRYGASPGQDEGSIPADVMAAWKAGKITVNGKPDAIAGALTIDWTNADEVKDAIYLFGGLHLNIDLPQEWADNPREWATQQSASRIVGGHSVVIIDFDERGVLIRTWGSTRFMPWAVLARLNRNTELYAVLSPDWTNDDRLAPNGVDVAKIETALAVLGQGGLPDDPTPVPPPSPPSPPSPPVPPMPTTPPNYEIHLTGPFGIKLSGVAVPADAPHAFSAAPACEHGPDYIAFPGDLEALVMGDRYCVGRVYSLTGLGLIREKDEPDNCGSAAPAGAISPVAVLADVYAIYTAIKADPILQAATTKLLVDLGLLHPTAAATAWGDGSILKILIGLAEKLLPIILPLILK